MSNDSTKRSGNRRHALMEAHVEPGTQQRKAFERGNWKPQHPEGEQSAEELASTL
jgi:hypothetical protein